MLKNFQLEPAAIVVSGMSLAGLGEAGILETLPKGALLAIIGIMFTVILFFAKRDYGRINTSIEKLAAAQSETNKKVDSAQSEMNKKIDANHTAVMIEIGNCVSVRDNSATVNGIFKRVNAIDRRTVVLETKAGLRGVIPTDDEEGSTEQT